MRENLGCTLTTIPGVNVITAVKILAEIGDIKRFSNANKLAQFAGIAPLHLSSSGKGKDLATKQGNRRLQATIYFLAIQMVQISSFPRGESERHLAVHRLRALIRHVEGIR